LRESTRGDNSLDRHREVSFEKKTATVTFDDAKADVKDFVAATTNAGYPSRLVEKKKETTGKEPKAAQ
jgi:hypothetical protein